MKAIVASTLCALALAGCGKNGDSAAPNASAIAAPPSSRGSSVDDDTTVRIVAKPPPIGTKTTQRRVSELKLTIVLDGDGPDDHKAVHIDRGEAETRKEEVLATSLTAVTSVKATFVEQNAHEDRNGKPQPVPPSTVVGKTYRITHHAESIEIVGDDGKPPPDRERDAVAQAFAHVGQTDPMMAALPQGRMRIGDHVLSMEATLGAILASDKHTKVHDVTVVLASVDDDKTIATFDVTAVADGDAGPVLTSTNYKGKLRLRIADGAPVELSIEGPVIAVTNQAAHPPGHPRGKGEARLALTTTYELRALVERQVPQDHVRDLVGQLRSHELRV